MSGTSKDHDRTIVFGEQAIEKIRSHKTSAYPRIYELWYTYATGHNPALMKAVNETLTREGGISENDIEEIYDNFLSPLRFSDRIDQVVSGTDDSDRRESRLHVRGHAER